MLLLSMSDHYRIILKRLLAQTYVRTYKYPFLLLLQFFEYIYIYIFREKTKETKYVERWLELEEITKNEQTLSDDSGNLEKRQ